MSASRTAQTDSNTTTYKKLTPNFESNSLELGPTESLETLALGENDIVSSSKIPSNHRGACGPSDAAAAITTNEASSQEDALHNRQHFTRSKNNMKTNVEGATTGKNGMYSLDAAGSDDLVDEAAVIAECSLLLARIDERAYQCALIRDANQIVERITLPMSFPWHHTIVPVVRNIPRDIDEMPAILSCDDEELSAFGNGPLGYGGFETGKQRRRLTNGKEGIRIASRRAEDVGVIELTMVKLPRGNPSYPANSSSEPKRRATNTIGVSLLSDFWKHMPACENSKPQRTPELQQLCDGDELVEGMLALESFKVAQSKKRRKVNEMIDNTQRIFVSVKVGNTSSRSSLFSPFAMASTPLLREAVCPQEIQQGKALAAASAKKLADEIGTFDCRYGAVRSSLTAKSNNRVHAGRTRIMWTYNGSSEHNKVLYSSTLRREKLEPGAQKRPTNVRVGVRLNGSLLSLDADLSSSRLSDSANGKPEEIPYSSKAVDAAVNAAFATLTSTAAKPQCLLDTGKFFHAIRLARGETPKTNSVELPFGVNLVRPTFDCLPLDDGAIVTTCAVPGKIQTVCVQECLNKAARRQGLVCSVCWTGSQPHLAIEECVGCGLTAHLACCSDRGERLPTRATKNGQAPKTWKCAACSVGVGVTVSPSAFNQASTEKRVKRATKIPAWLDNDHVAFVSSGRAAVSNPPGDDIQRCSCCPHTGGAMSAATDSNGEKVWVHEVCRVWQETPTANAVSDHAPCALCGTPNTITSECNAKKSLPTRLGPNFTTKCAANGCHIRFHPMCALLVSKLAEEEESLLPSKSEPGSPQPRLERDKSDDIRHTNKFTLTFAQVSYNPYTEYTTDGIGKLKSREKSSTLVPLAFCGIHNPERDPSLYGSYPAGLHFDESVLRIPPKRKRGARLSR